MIFYLSCTGNTRWAARQVAEKTGDRLVFIPDCIKDLEAEGEYSLELGEDERLGICFPVHGWRPPKMVRQFISRLSIKTQGHYVFALCTAGDNIGETIDILRGDLQQRGIHLDAAFSLIMPESYLGLPFFYLDKPEKEKLKKETSAKKLESYIPKITARQTAHSLVLGKWPKTNSRLLGAFFTKYLLTDRKFRADSHLCTRCGLCAKVCPVGNILYDEDAMPMWRHNHACMACFSCYHHCPNNAIEYGHLTKGKGQYFFEKRK